MHFLAQNIKLLVYLLVNMALFTLQKNSNLEIIPSGDMIGTSLLINPSDIEEKGSIMEVYMHPKGNDHQCAISPNNATFKICPHFPIVSFYFVLGLSYKNYHRLLISLINVIFNYSSEIVKSLIYFDESQMKQKNLEKLKEISFSLFESCPNLLLRIQKHFSLSLGRLDENRITMDECIKDISELMFPKRIYNRQINQELANLNYIEIIYMYVWTIMGRPESFEKFGEIYFNGMSFKYQIELLLKFMNEMIKMVFKICLSQFIFVNTENCIHFKKIIKNIKIEYSNESIQNNIFEEEKGNENKELVVDLENSKINSGMPYPVISLNNDLSNDLIFLRRWKHLIHPDYHYILDLLYNASSYVK